MDEASATGMKIMRVFAWSGFVVIAGLVFAQGFVLGFVPPTSPAWSAQQISDLYANNSTRIQIGCVIQIVFWTLFTTWTIPIIILLRRIERRNYKLPLMTYASLVACGGGSAIFIMIPMSWAVIAFRAGTVNPEIMLVLNDWVWFLWLYTWPGFALWVFIIAAAILLDRTADPVYPRWMGFASLWTGILMIPAGAMGFFKTGPFAYNGIIAFWTPVVPYFSWMLTLTCLTIKAINTAERKGQPLWE